MTTHKELSRKAVRDDVAAMFERMAGRAGATFELDTNPLTPRGVTLYLRRDGVACMIHLNGSSRAGSFLGHWFFDDRAGRLFRNGFDGHGYRAHHKATVMTDTAEALCDRLETMFGWIADGSAFTPEADRR